MTCRDSYRTYIYVYNNMQKVFFTFWGNFPPNKNYIRNAILKCFQYIKNNCETLMSHKKGMIKK
jgi:hypothetical protein